MPLQTWESVWNAPGWSPGSALLNSTTITDISPAPQLVIPANTLYIGQRLRVKGYGLYSSSGTPTLTLGVYYGGVGGTTLAVTAANAVASGAASFPWTLNLEIYVRAVGSTGSLWCSGEAKVGSALTAYTGYVIPSSQTQPIAVNTTNASALTVGAQWGTAATANTITCEDAYIEAIS